jgi:hypothetical protein
VPTLAVGAVALRPVIETRLANFDSSTGLPQSWTIRLENLRLFVWPRLAGLNWLFGVRPSAKIPVAASWGPFIYIESGHTWLLWTGGVPLFLAFGYFSWVAVRTAAAVGRIRRGIVATAGISALASTLVVFVLMSFDPHITMRGAADLLFSLLALATAVRPPRRASARVNVAPAAAGTPAPSSTAPTADLDGAPVPA